MSNVVIRNKIPSSARRLADVPILDYFCGKVSVGNFTTGIYEHSGLWLKLPGAVINIGEPTLSLFKEDRPELYDNATVQDYVEVDLEIKVERTK